MSTRLGVIADWEILAQKANFRPSDLADLCHISLRTLERYFQQKYSLTVVGWLRQLRMTLAYEHLLTGKPVKEVAYDMGFKQVSHFSREFKNYFGIPPSFLNPIDGPADLEGNPFRRGEEPGMCVNY